MHHRAKKLLAAAALGFISALTLAVTPAGAGTETIGNRAGGKVFKIGVILPLTGPAALIGTPIKNGIELYKQSLPEEMKNRVEIVLEDDGNDPKRTVAAFRKLLSADKVNAVITAASNTSKAVSPIADSTKTPLIAIASDYDVVRGREYAVNLWVTPEEEARLLQPEAVRRGYKKIARITAMNDFALAVKNAFDQFNQGAIALTADEEYPPDARDFRPFLSKLKDAEPDAIFVNLYVGQIGLFARQARELGITVPLFGCEMFEDSGEVKASNGALIGQWYVQADEGTGTFVQKYLGAFPNAPLFAAANGYDAMALVFGAVQQGKTAPAELMLFLKSVKDFNGALGGYSSTADNRFTLPAALKVITASGFEKLPKTS